MRFFRTAAIAAAFVCVGSVAASAQVQLDAYLDKNGYLDVQKLTCAQLANTFQEDADLLELWYSGWYNGLAKKHYFDYRRAKVSEHRLIMYCKEHQDTTVIKALDVVFKSMR